MTYAIHESNMERLRQKIGRIQNKCIKYGCDFIFNEVGEEYRTLTNEQGFSYTARFIIVEAEGKSIINGWQFIASVEHTGKGNIIKRVCNIEVPERYYTSQPICEHCNSRRARKDTYIVMNEETGEFKQVGKSCLKDFTHGMSAEAVAQYMAAFDCLIEGEKPDSNQSDSLYISLEEWLSYVVETINHFGYMKRDNDLGEVDTCTKALNFFIVNHGGYVATNIRKKSLDEIVKSGFNPEKTEVKKDVEIALDWISEQQPSNNYMHNLKVACSLPYINQKHFALTASLFPTFKREIGLETERQQAKSVEMDSNWAGDIGNRIEINPENITCVTSWETQWGTTKIYKIIDTNGNIFIWKTSNFIEEENVKHIKGTVKAHNVYNNVKQTELTRCKVS